MEESPLRPSRRVAAFQKRLESRGVTVTVRRRLGSDMVELLDQYLLQYVTLLFAQYQSTIRYQSQTVE